MATSDGPNVIALSAFCISQNYSQPEYNFVELLDGWGCTVMYTTGMSVSEEAEATKELAKEKAALKALVDLGLEESSQSSQAPKRKLADAAPEVQTKMAKMEGFELLCPHCPSKKTRTYKDMKALAPHITTKHPGEKVPVDVSNIPKYIPPTKAPTKVLSPGDEGAPCPHCPATKRRKYKDNKAIKYHIDAKHPGSEVPVIPPPQSFESAKQIVEEVAFLCPHCPSTKTKKFSTIEHLKPHVEAKHPGNEVPQDPSKVPSVMVGDEVEMEKETTQDNRIFRCVDCPENIKRFFKGSNSIKLHLETKHSDSPTTKSAEIDVDKYLVAENPNSTEAQNFNICTCPYCPPNKKCKPYSNIIGLVRHIAQKHPEKPESAKISNFEEEIPEGGESCHLCPLATKKYLTRQSLNSHIKNKHSNISDIVRQSMPLLPDTVVTDHGYVCSLCPGKHRKKRNFTELDALMSHIQDNHTVEGKAAKPDPDKICEISNCSFKTSSAQKLKSHQWRIHSQMQCALCELVFVNLQNCLWHVKKEHHDRKEFSIGRCKRKEKEIESVKVDYDNNYPCLMEGCDNTSQRLGDWYKHARNNHKEACNMCNKKYSVILNRGCPCVIKAEKTASDAEEVAMAD